MRFLTKVTVFLAAAVLLTGITACAKIYGPTGAGPGSLNGAKSGWYTAYTASAVVTINASNPGVLYKGAAEDNEANLFLNPDFNTDGVNITAPTVGNWAYSSTDMLFNQVSPPGSPNQPPVNTCLFYPCTASINLTQRVAVEKGAWYNVSYWCYSSATTALGGAGSGGAGVMADLDLFADDTSTGNIARINLNMGFLFKTTGSWQQLSFIIQIPSDLPTDTPYFELRLARNTTVNELYITRAEMYKLDSASQL
ncbi:MAG: hypothetical protein FWF29_08200 [Treponema sp.]|nr:hypothetical protein [Treponema sp.]